MDIHPRSQASAYRTQLAIDHELCMSHYREGIDSQRNHLVPDASLGSVVRIFVAFVLYKVYHLRNALYGLKLSPRAWYDDGISNFLISTGFTKDFKQDRLKKPQEVKWIFSLLRGTLTSSLVFEGFGFELTAFSDADHAGCIDTRKSTSGGIQFLGDKLVSWMSKKQDCTTMSSAEAEYVALSASCAQVENGIIELYFVKTEYQLADMSTKALSEDRFQYLVRQIGMRYLTPVELEFLTNESA
ncbi:hypothetical protein Tco_0715990 [Tanacetum coccineum]